MKSIRNRTTAAAAALALATGFTALSSPAFAADGDGRLSTTIGTWYAYGDVANSLGFVDVGPGATQTLFTVPAPGTSGPIEFTLEEAGEPYCLLVSQNFPFTSLYWGPATAANPCQNVTTVVVAGTAQVGFMATDGPYAGRYLGDQSQGALVDWASESFFGVDVPEIQAPAPLDDTATTSAGTPVTIAVLGNDGDTSGWTVTPGTAPGHGTAAFNPDGTVSYTPDADFSGTDVFTYVVTDSNRLSATATVTVTVTAPPTVTQPDPTSPTDGAATAPAGQDPSAKGPVELARTGIEVDLLLGLMVVLLATGSALAFIARRKTP